MTTVGVVDEPLFADLFVIVVRGLLLLFFFTLVICCDIFPVIGLRGCAFFSFFTFAWLGVLPVEFVDFLRQRRHKVV